MCMCVSVCVNAKGTDISPAMLDVAVDREVGVLCFVSYVCVHACVVCVCVSMDDCFYCFALRGTQSFSTCSNHSYVHMTLKHFIVLHVLKKI